MPDHDGDMVLKVLLPRQDSRVDLTSLASRQACQIEGLYWNTYFTKDVYLGLVPLPAQDFKSDLKSISIGSLVTSVEEVERSPAFDAEYGLLMRALPDERRLDNVLLTTRGDVLHLLLAKLVMRIRDMHTISPPPLKGTDCSVLSDPPSGSYKQIKRKLEHNLNFLHAVILLDNKRYGDLCRSLISGLHAIINTSLYENYFSSRLHRQFVKRCHGDLKTPNIWIEEGVPQAGDYGVKILDAIDFNDNYCTIDILSDFAMLAVDVELRTHTAIYVDTMIQTYLHLTEQLNDNAAYHVLNYYLIEKAVINAAVCILYDQQPDLGLRFLHQAKQHMKELQSIHSRYYAFSYQTEEKIYGPALV